jgi:hypothetical protein
MEVIDLIPSGGVDPVGDPNGDPRQVGLWRVGLRPGLHEAESVPRDDFDQRAVVQREMCCTTRLRGECGPCPRFAHRHRRRDDVGHVAAEPCDRIEREVDAEITGVDAGRGHERQRLDGFLRGYQGSIADPCHGPPPREGQEVVEIIAVETGTQHFALFRRSDTRGLNDSGDGIICGIADEAAEIECAPRVSDPGEKRTGPVVRHLDGTAGMPALRWSGLGLTSAQYRGAAAPEYDADAIESA